MIWENLCLGIYKQMRALCRILGRWTPGSGNISHDLVGWAAMDKYYWCALIVVWWIPTEIVRNCRSFHKRVRAESRFGRRLVFATMDWNEFLLLQFYISPFISEAQLWRWIEKSWMENCLSELRAIAKRRSGSQNFFDCAGVILLSYWIKISILNNIQSINTPAVGRFIRSVWLLTTLFMLNRSCQYDQELYPSLLLAQKL